MTDDDLIPRLRAVFGGGTWGSPAVRLCHAAADALEAAKRENERLRDALTKIETGLEFMAAEDDDAGKMASRLLPFARAALATDQKGGETG